MGKTKSKLIDGWNEFILACVFCCSEMTIPVVDDQPPAQKQVKIPPPVPPRRKQIMDDDDWVTTTDFENDIIVLP